MMKKIIIIFFFTLLFCGQAWAENGFQPNPLMPYCSEIKENGDNSVSLRVLSYPKYYQKEDLTFEEVNPNWEVSDTSIADWMVKKGVYKIYAKNNGWIGVEHQGRVLKQKLLYAGYASVAKADTNFTTLLSATPSIPTITGPDLKWTNYFRGVNFHIKYRHGQYREIIEISQALRDSLSTSPNRPQDHGYTMNDYFVFVFQLDVSGLNLKPFIQTTETTWVEKNFNSNWEVKDRWRDWNTIKFGSALNKITRVFPLGYVWHEAWDTTSNKDTTSNLRFPKLRRIIRRGGNLYYVIGAKLSKFASMPEGKIYINDSARLQQGNQYGNTKDARLDNPTWGYGSDPEVRVVDDVDIGDALRAHTIICWDSLEDAIPGGATITAMNCSLSNANNAGGANTMYIKAYQVLEAWDYEASGYHKLPTWKRRLLPYATCPHADCWTNDGADTATSSSSTVEGDSVGVTNTDWTWWSWTLSTATGQSWLDSPSTNYGLMFRSKDTGAGGNNNTRLFVSSDHADSTSRYPILNITYTTDGEPAVGERRRPSIIGGG